MKKKCAVCGNTSQTNIIFKWQRFSDNKVFHVCGMCAEEPGKVNADSVKEIITKTYTTVDSEYVASNDSGTFRARPNMSSHYNGKSNLAMPIERGRPHKISK